MTASPMMMTTTPEQQQFFEIIDSKELARRWAVPATWVYEQTRSRASDPLTCVRLGRYCRFEWNSPSLQAWWARRRTGKTR